MNQPTSFRIQVRVSHEVPLIAVALNALLTDDAGFAIATTDGEADVLVTDLAGALAIGRQRRAAGAGQTPRLLIVADSTKEADVRAALHAGAFGYMSVDSDVQQLLVAIAAVARGTQQLCPRAAACVAESFLYDDLTPREFDVLELMTKGMGDKDIARRLGVTVGTVKAHARALFSKLNVHTRLQAALVASERGLAVRDRSVLPRPTIAAVRGLRPSVREHAACA